MNRFLLSLTIALPGLRLPAAVDEAAHWGIGSIPMLAAVCVFFAGQPGQCNVTPVKMDVIRHLQSSLMDESPIWPRAAIKQIPSH